MKLFIILLFFCIQLNNIAFSETYQFDDLNRLTRVSYDNGQTISYQYDDAGNITSSTISGAASNSLTIQTPNGNENWPIGSSQILRWTSSPNTAQTVKIALYRGATQTRLIANSTANTGSYTWVIPTNLTPHNDYQIKITSNSDSSISDSSDANFEITTNTTSVLLSSIAINGATSVNENSSAIYTATAHYSDGSSEDVTTRASWSENSPYASISNKGVLSTTEVLNDTTLTVSASYSYQTTSKSNSKSVKIINQGGGGSEPISDSDGDGISDIEEIKYGLNPNDPSDAGADKDNDGYSNIEEIEAGSDINDPNSLPKRLSEITATKISERLNSKGYVSLVVEDNLAYLLAEDKLEIVDISNEENIQLLSTLNLEGSANKIVKSNDFIYIAHGKYGLRIVNISNSKAPKIVGTFYTGTDSWTGWVEDVAVHGDYAYIAYNGGGGLNIVNISNKENPTLEGKYSQGGFGFVKVQGGYIYVDSFAGKRGLSIVKFNPLATFDQRVTLVGRYDEDSSSAYVVDVSIKGNIAYLLINHVGVRVLDISNKSQPTLISTISFDDNHASLNALAQYLFVSSSNFLGVQIFDVGDKKYKLLGKLNPYSGSRQSIFINNNLYVVGSSKGFRIYKITPNLFSSNMSSNNTNGLVSPIIYMLLMPNNNLY